MKSLRRTRSPSSPPRISIVSVADLSALVAARLAFSNSPCTIPRTRVDAKGYIRSRAASDFSCYQPRAICASRSRGSQLQLPLDVKRESSEQLRRVDLQPSRQRQDGYEEVRQLL